MPKNRKHDARPKNFSDLGVELRSGLTPEQAVGMSNRLKALGYTRLAWNQTVHGLDGVKGLDKDEKSVASVLKGKTEHDGVAWLRRVTVVVEDVNEAQFLKGTIRLLQRFDLVAARPTTDAAMAFLCESSDVDIISLDHTLRPPLQLNAKLVEKAVTRGLFFEVRYGPVIEEAPGQRRQQFMSMLMNTFDVLRGKHAMVTSGARAVEPLRGAHDVVNLAIVLGLKEEHAYNAVSSVCEMALGHARARQLEWTPIEIQRLEGGAVRQGGAEGSGKASASQAVPMDI